MFKKFTSAAVLIVGLAAFTACDKDNNTTPANDTVQLTASLTGAQEVPANASAGTGSFTGSYNKSTHVLTYTVTYQGITPTMGHIHAGVAGQNGDAFVPFSNVASSPITGTATLSDASANSLLSGAYVNFHSSAYAGGEIRGNITTK
ncbi:CHRD domain-containing protein [Hymenobacter jejuensis]|uniref:CHRD domain-containing protein n=1 Tax=Hymenobacter jejuensis TaxID=2502781 RepID=A0A5B7ZYC3_9BACT|nr:CHRD domain-containing protein [Hymenobacter jejuensis]QDA59506.1 CHRD domain-containing protein [Hymenobacter jejuensis]